MTHGAQEGVIPGTVGGVMRAFGTILGGVVGLAGCADKPLRPTPGAMVVEAAAIDEESGLLVFSTEAPADGRAEYHVARHSASGPVAWVRPLDVGPEFPGIHGIELFGGSGLLMASRADKPAEEVVRVGLADGQVSAWRSSLEEPSVWATAGDEAQVFVFWQMTPRIGRQSRPLEVAAFDAVTGDRQWTVIDRVDVDAPTKWSVRVADDWLMFAGDGEDWRMLRRRDGSRSTAVVADAPGLCRAGDGWWTQREGRLLALDLTGDTPVARAAEVSFVPAEARGQWSIDHCTEFAGEVVLLVDRGLLAGAALAAVDPAGLQLKWTLDLEVLGLSRDMNAVWPVRAGRVVLVRRWIGSWCAVDLEARAAMWCINQVDVHAAYVDGEDTILIVNHEERPLMLRVSGRDGEVQAASLAEGVMFGLSLSTRPQISGPRGGRIWLASAEDPEPGQTARLPHVVLDARTLRSVDRPTRTHRREGEWPVGIEVRDVMKDIDTLLPRTQGFWSPAYDPVEVVAVNPLDLWAADGPPTTEASARGLARVLAAARVSAGLAADVPIQVLASRIMSGLHTVDTAEGTQRDDVWRRDDVLAFAAAGADRWVLIAAEAHGWMPPANDQVRIRVFERRPTPHDVYRFVSEGGLPSAAETSLRGVAGRVDEAAWLALTGVPRDQRWLLP